MDIKYEIEIKDEPLEGADDQIYEQLLELQQFQDESCDPIVDIKSEIEIKEELLDIKMENPMNDEFLKLKSEIAEKQNLIFQDHKEKVDVPEGKRSSRKDCYNLRREKKRAVKHDWKKCICSDCDFTFEREEELISHLKSLYKRNIKFPRCIYDYSCESKSEKEPVSLRHKDECILNTKLFKCSKCDYECAQKALLKSHSLRHEKILYKCSECSYSSYHELCFQRHLLIHQNFKFKCSYCDFESNQKINLKLHILKHQNIKLFKCPECRYTCNDERDLKLHMLMYQNIGGKMRTTWSLDEKCEIYWCYLYARHNKFPKKDTFKRMRGKLMKRGRINRDKIEKNPDSLFSSIASNVRLEKTPITKTEMERIKAEVDAAVENDSETENSQDKQNDESKWNLETNLYLMESYFIGEYIRMKKGKSKLWKYIVENKEIGANDFMEYWFKKKYKNVNRKSMIKQKHCILKFAKERKGNQGRKIKATLPTEEELERIREETVTIVENLDINVDMVQEIKSCKEKLYKTNVETRSDSDTTVKNEESIKGGEVNLRDAKSQVRKKLKWR